MFSFEKLRERPQELLDKCVSKDKQWLVYASGAAIGGWYVAKKAAEMYNHHKKLAEYKQLGQQKLLEIATKPHPICDNYIVSNRNELLTKKIRHKVIETMSAVNIRDAIINGEYSCQQILAIFVMESIDANKSLNAIIETHYDSAMKLAISLDNKLISLKKEYPNNNNYKEYIIKHFPLFGIPLSIKDLLEMQDSDCTNGILRLCMHKRTHDGETVQLLKDCGGIPFVKSTTPQLNMLPETFNHITGHTRNPHDLTRTPCGSSGGEAALVGAKASVLGVGTDIGGSLRMPAHMAGCMAYKPNSKRTIQRGRVTALGYYSNKGRINAVTGPLGMYGVKSRAKTKKKKNKL